MKLRYPSKQLIRANWQAGRKVHAQSQRNGLWVGVIKPCGVDHLLFLSVSQKWIEMILNQDFRQFSEAATEPSSEQLLLQWQAGNKELDRLNPWLPKLGRVDYRKGDSMYQVSLPAVVHQASSGFAFALIEKP